MYTKTYFVYIVTNAYNTTLYVGMTDNLVRRVNEHREGLIEGFSKKYKLKKLVYFEDTNNVISAIEREKQLKRWHRQWKINLIRSKNQNFDDLYKTII